MSFSYAFKFVIAALAILVGIIFHLFLCGAILATTLLWLPFYRWTQNPAYWWAYVYYWWLRVTYFCLGITVRITAPEDVPDGPVSVLADHGTLATMLLQAVHVVIHFRRRAKINIKASLMYTPVGWGMRMMGIDIALPREDRGLSIQRIEAARGDGSPFTGMIYATGHRPSRNRVADAQKWLRSLGYDPQKLQHTCAPRPSGPFTLITVQEPETVYLQMVAGSQRDEGWFGIINLMYGGAIVLKYNEVTPDMQDQQAFARWLTMAWLDRVNPWIGYTRSWWASLSSEQASRYFWRQLRFWR